MRSNIEAMIIIGSAFIQKWIDEINLSATRLYNSLKNSIIVGGRCKDHRDNYELFDDIMEKRRKDYPEI